MLSIGLFNPEGICYLCNNLLDDLTQNYLFSQLWLKGGAVFEKVMEI